MKTLAARSKEFSSGWLIGAVEQMVRANLKASNICVYCGKGSPALFDVLTCVPHPDHLRLEAAKTCGECWRKNKGGDFPVLIPV